jgi:hypothetical protein
MVAMRRARTALTRLCRSLKPPAKRYDTSKVKLLIGGEVVAVGTCTLHGSEVRGRLTMVRNGGGNNGK